MKLPRWIDIRAEYYSAVYAVRLVDSRDGQGSSGNVDQAHQLRPNGSGLTLPRRSEVLWPADNQRHTVAAVVAPV